MGGDQTCNQGLVTKAYAKANRIIMLTLSSLLACVVLATMGVMLDAMGNVEASSRSFHRDIDQTMEKMETQVNDVENMAITTEVRWISIDRRLERMEQHLMGPRMPP